MGKEVTRYRTSANGVFVETHEGHTIYCTHQHYKATLCKTKAFYADLPGKRKYFRFLECSDISRAEQLSKCRQLIDEYNKS